MHEYYDDAALLPDNWQEGDDLFAPPADGPLDPPGGFGTGVQEGEEEDLTAAVRELQRLYPDFTRMPEEVARAAAAGTPLKEAYGAWRLQQAEAENEQLRRAKSAPVRAVGGGGEVAEGGDGFLLGFNHEAW